VNRGQKEAYKRDYARAKAEGKPFFPYAVAHDLVVATLAVGIVIALSIWQRVGVGEPVNPASTDYVPRPEWYFFFLFELLRIFKGENALTPVIMATFVIPTVLMVLLLAWPFIDRGPERRPHRRPVAMVSGLAVIVFLAYLTYLGATAPEGISGGEVELELTNLDPQAEAGLAIFTSSVGNCLSCHMLKGQGAGGPGPNLTSEGTRNRGVAWQIRHLRDPQSVSPGSIMPSYAALSQQQLQQLATLLEGLGTKYR
jgi:menaquinol-cytochrome c reductase cytochrome b/c subunit